MGGNGIVHRIISTIRKVTGGNNTEFGEENRLTRPAGTTQQSQQGGSQNLRQPLQDVYSKQENMEEKE